MGSSFTNVQVHTGAADRSAGRARIVEQLRSHFRGLGLVEMPAASAGGRRVLVGPPGQGPWIAVYDSMLEGQDEKPILDLTTSLSQAFPGPAAGVRVHDGDLLDIWLMGGDRARRDHVCNWPGYFAGKAPAARATGHPHAWRAALDGEVATDALEAAWTNSPVPDAAAILTRMAPIVGWDASQVCAGFQSLPESLRVACVELTFGGDARVGAASSAGPPALGHAGGTPGPIQARRGESITVAAIAHNTGGPLKGLSVVVFGPAIDSDLVRPDSVVLTIGDPSSGRQHALTLSMGAAAPPVIWSATATDLDLPAGFKDMAATYGASAGARDAIALWLSTRVEAQVHAKVVESGRGELHIGLVPVENPEGGQVAWTVELRGAA